MVGKLPGDLLLELPQDDSAERLFFGREVIQPAAPVQVFLIRTVVLRDGIAALSDHIFKLADSGKVLRGILIDRQFFRRNAPQAALCPEIEQRSPARLAVVKHSLVHPVHRRQQGVFDLHLGH